MNPHPLSGLKQSIPEGTKKALCVAITPCLQRTLVFPRLVLDTVNRARHVLLSPGGKSVNVARALRSLDVPCHVLGFRGAATGQQLQDLLRHGDIDAELIPIEHPTRTCTTLIDETQGTVTELVEEAPCPTVAEWRAFETRVEERLPDFELAIAAGALPPGDIQERYARLAKCAAQHHTGLILDTSGPALVKALPYTPLLAKLNHHELITMTHLAVPTSESLIRAARALAGDGATWVLVTQASEPAYLVSETEAWHVYPPQIQASNPVGSGDATTAGIAAALLQGHSMLEAVRWGIACGSASATTLTAGEVPAALAERLAAEVRLQRHPR